MLVEEYIFQVERTTDTLLPESTYRIAVEPGVNAQQFQPHTCLLDTAAGLNLVSKAFLKK